MSSKNTILLTGGTGKISRCLAPYLSSAGHHITMASRSGTCPLLPNCQGIAFNWLDSSTYSNLDLPSISTILLIAPPIIDPFPPMKDFIDLSILQGVRRLVLISGSLLDVGDGPMMARVSKYITTLGVEYAILRPSWFMGMLLVFMLL
jgi:festuclavine dehydrogenase